MVSPRKCLLVVINIVATVLTLWTGMRENAVLSFMYGRFGLIRSRFVQGRINYDIVLDDHLDIAALPDLRTVGESYHFHSAPTRSPANLGEDRSICERVNSMNASVFGLHFRDFYGHGPRREQIFLYSISAPHCRVLNLKPAWVADECTRDQFAGNATACHAYIRDHFDALSENRLVQAGIPKDFGIPGVPFLKCRNRPEQRFRFIADLLVLQSFWAGGSYHVEVQSSQCWANPVMRHADGQWGLFQVTSVDQSADVFAAIPPSNWFVQLVSSLYSIVSLVMIVRGVLGWFASTRVVYYIPSAVRWKLFGWINVPFVEMARLVFLPNSRSHALAFHGYTPSASDLWMNNWLYITLSIIESVVNVRTMYVTLQMGSWMLSKHVNVENFIFVCSALTKLTWITCFLHTIVRFAVRVIVRLLQPILCIAGTRWCRAIGWYVDSVALLVNFKIYSLLLVVQLVCLLRLRGTTTLMVRDTVYKQPVYGGASNLSSFWRSEIVCDVLVIGSIQLLAAHILMSLLLLTKLRYVTCNRVMHVLQERFVFVGWDVFVSMETLGIVPFRDHGVVDGVATTHCSFAALLQQMYASGPSGWVEFVGDDGLIGPGDRDETNKQAPIEYERYDIDTARAMGLYEPLQRQWTRELSRWYSNRVTSSPAAHGVGDTSNYSMRFPPDSNATRRFSRPTSVGAKANEDSAALKWASAPEVAPTAAIAAPALSPIDTMFQQQLLRVHAEGRWGRLLLVDTRRHPGRVSGAENAGAPLECAVRDALRAIRARDLPALLGPEQALRLC